jgi:hypothetical protein
MKWMTEGSNGSKSDTDDFPRSKAVYSNKAPFTAQTPPDSA